VSATRALLHGSVIGGEEWTVYEAGPFPAPGSHRAIQSEPTSPSSHPKQRHKSDELGRHDIALRRRLTVWFTEAAIAAWKAEPRATRGGQPRHSALAITTAMTLRAVFRLALRQTEGLITSLVCGPLCG
jgi:hypothetical protein